MAVPIRAMDPQVPLPTARKTLHAFTDVYPLPGRVVYTKAHPAVRLHHAGDFRNGRGPGIERSGDAVP
jgi:hypothetical protein